MRIPLIALLALVCTASVRAAPSAQGSFWSCPAGFEGQVLNVYNWTTYIAEDTISNFERLCSVTVNYNTYGGDDEMLEEVRQGNAAGYDLVVPSDSTVYLMVEEGLLQPINQGRISNFANLDDEFRDPPYDPDNRYTVPYQWGTMSVGYHRARVGQDITTWEQVFTSPARIAWIDDGRAMLAFALNALGYDANTSNPTEVNAAAQYLIDHSANVVAIAPDTGQDLLVSGDADIAIEYSGDIFQIIGDCACDDYAYVIPNEGALLWTDNLAIPTGAPNKPLAETFIDYLLNPQVSADISNYTAYGTPNAVAITEGLIESTYLDNPAIYPDDTLRERLFYNISNAELEQLYGNAWTRVRSAVEG